MKSYSVIFLQGVVVLIALLTLALLIRMPLTEGRADGLDLFSIYTDSLILYAYTVSVAFFMALFKAFRLLSYIRQNEIFSPKAVATLRSIKHCAIIISLGIVAAGIFIRFCHNPEDDPAGFIALCILTTFVSVVAATVAGIFEKVLQNAVNIQSENELTI